MFSVSCKVLGVAVETALTYREIKPEEEFCGCCARNRARAFFIFSAISAAFRFTGRNYSSDGFNKCAPPTLPTSACNSLSCSGSMLVIPSFVGTMNDRGPKFIFSTNSRKKSITNSFRSGIPSIFWVIDWFRIAQSVASGVVILRDSLFILNTCMAMK